MRDKPKIVDNPSFKEMLDGFKVAKIISKVPFIKHIAPSIHNNASEFLKGEPQFSKLIETPDIFNESFSKLAWIAYGSISLNVMQTAITLYDTEGEKSAEDYLAGTYDEDTIRRGIRNCGGNKHFEKRMRLLKLAKIDYLEGRYHACVPLLITLLDGVVNDISNHVGFFAEKVNLTVWDSIAAHETGLQALAKIMTKGTKKTNEHRITIPYRHGILHGRELAFDNKLVAAKCWAALFAVRNWAEDLEKSKDEPKVEEKYGLKEFYTNRIAAIHLNNAIEAWNPRDMTNLDYLPFSGDSESLPDNTPERAVAKFLEYWHKQSFQLICDMLVYPKKAVQAKTDFGKNAPTSFKILSIEDTAPAVTRVIVELSFKTESKIVNKEIPIMTNYLDSEGGTLVRSDPNGAWKVMQAGLAGIIYS